MRVSGLNPRCAGTRLRGMRIGVACAGVAMALFLTSADALEAQGWRSRISSRVQYVEANSLVRDSVPAADAVFMNGRWMAGDSVVTCSSGRAYCYFYTTGSTLSTYPSVLDVDLNVFALGVEGLRFYVNSRWQTDFGGDEFWPQSNETVQLLNAYAELNRRHWRVRLGRDYKLSGLGFYGYDGGSLLLRATPLQARLELYGGWGLARGIPVPVTADIFDDLGVPEPDGRTYLFGVQGSARPTHNSSLSVIYQREITGGDRNDIATERLAFEGTWSPIPEVSLQGHADYDLAAGWLGKTGLQAGWQVTPKAYVEGGYLRYRPVFSLQTIWVAFSPVAYNGWNLSGSYRALPNLRFKAWVERRVYEDTEAESPFMVTNDSEVRYGLRGNWDLTDRWELDGGYWRSHGFGALLNSGDLRVGFQPWDRLALGARFSAWQQLQEFRVNEGRVYGIGIDARWRTTAGTVWWSIDRYDHDNRGDAAIRDYSQWRSALGFSYYLGSEPGRAP